MESDFKSYPQSRDAKDYWGQVKRTVNGVPVSEEQIQLIVDAIRRELALRPGGADRVLDIGCGNGALSALLFDQLASLHGVDYSEYLVSVAQRDFQRAPAFTFEVADALDYVTSAADPGRFNKVLCYGCFSYFRPATQVLATLHDRFPAVERVFIGNLPDKDRAALFYRNGLPSEAEMADHDSKIGVWRTAAEFEALAREAGWMCHISRMPSDFYAGHYRYDATLTRRA